MTINGLFGLTIEGYADPAIAELREATARSAKVAVHAMGLAVTGGSKQVWTEMVRQSERDGRLSWVAEQDGSERWRFWGPEYGECVVSDGGRMLSIAAASGGMPELRQLMLGQALPFAALQQGLEPFHASAVTSSRGVIAFSGPSGAGKSSLAAAALSRGARLVSDDVLTVEVLDGRVVAHPGTAELRLRRDRPIGQPADDRERGQTHPTRVDTHLPLAAFCMITRPDRSQPHPYASPVAFAPRPILASSFNYMLQSPERLMSQLELCSRMSETVRIIELGLDLGDRSDDVLDALEDAFPVAWF